MKTMLPTTLGMLFALITLLLSIEWVRQTKNVEALQERAEVVTGTITDKYTVTNSRLRTNDDFHRREDGITTYRLDVKYTTQSGELRSRPHNVPKSWFEFYEEGDEIGVTYDPLNDKLSSVVNGDYAAGVKTLTWVWGICLSISIFSFALRYYFAH